jgi:hypothetical protein
MSVAVDLSQLADTLAAYPWGYLVSVGEHGRAHSLAVPTDYRDGSLHLVGGRSSRANVEARPEVTMVFPHPLPGQYSLILDGVAAVHGESVVFTPSHAILHRPAIAG